MQKIKLLFKTIPNWAKLLLKVVIMMVCLWYVSSKINWENTFQLIKKSDKTWLLLALVLIAASKMASAYRLTIYFKNIGLILPAGANIRLYWLGMFYNIFLPGGIGGDAYKVVVLSEKFKQVSSKKIAAAVLLDRISGVAALGVLGVFFYCLIFSSQYYSWLLASCILPTIFGFYFFVKKIFPSFIKGFSATFFWGLLVQLLQVAAVFCIMLSVHIQGHYSQFQFLFLLSSIVAILPITMGGLGAREIVFLQGASYFLLDANTAIYISLLFYLLQLTISFFGIRWMYKTVFETA